MTGQRGRRVGFNGGWYYNSVLTTEQTYQTARLDLVQEPTARRSETAALFQALGGGRWNREDVTAVARTVSASNSAE
jgi:hypothetical protein